MKSIREVIKNHNFAVLDGSFYMIYPENSIDQKNLFKWYDNSFVLEKVDDLSFLDKAYLNNNHSRIRSEIVDAGERLYQKNLDSIIDSEFIEMFHEHILPAFESNKKRENKVELSDVEISIDSTQKSFVNVNALFIDQNCYPLSANRWTFDYYLLIDGKKYSIGSSGNLSVDEVVNSWESHLKENLSKGIGKLAERSDRIRQISKTGKWHDLNKGIGYVKQQDKFLVYATVPAFCLHEVKNNKYYSFNETRVGIRVYNKGNWMWDNPIVIDRYSHPFLPHLDEEMQEICIGPYLKQLQRMKKSLMSDQSLLPRQIVHVLEYSKKLLMKGYRPDRSKVLPWKRLHKDFSNVIPDNKVGTEQRYVATNIGDDWI